MEIVKINWIQTNFNQVGNWYDTYFYAFSRGNNLLYIGISYKQNVKTEIAQNLRRLEVNTTGLTIWLGYIDNKQTTYKRITNQIVLDAECLMISANEPSYNIQCIENYRGRCNLKIKTSGCSLIRRCVRCENNRIYITC